MLDNVGRNDESSSKITYCFWTEHLSVHMLLCLNNGSHQKHFHRFSLQDVVPVSRLTGTPKWNTAITDFISLTSVPQVKCLLGKVYKGLRQTITWSTVAVNIPCKYESLWCVWYVEKDDFSPLTQKRCHNSTHSPPEKYNKNMLKGRKVLLLFILIRQYWF